MADKTEMTQQAEPELIQNEFEMLETRIMKELCTHLAREARK